MKPRISSVFQRTSNINEPSTKNATAIPIHNHPIRKIRIRISIRKSKTQRDLVEIGKFRVKRVKRERGKIERSFFFFG